MKTQDWRCGRLIDVGERRFVFDEIPKNRVHVAARVFYRDYASLRAVKVLGTHVRAAGYEERVIEAPTINAVEAKLGVPVGLRSCHTAEIDRYVLEGHVPAAAIARLLAERPNARGLAVPGMPIGSPGMEVEGREPETFEVMLFGDGEPKAFIGFRGSTAI